MERIRRFFRKLGKGLKNKGYTLLEVAAVVAVSATLAAVALPVVADKLGDAKVVGGTQQAQGIKDGIVNFLKDTGVPPFYGNYASYPYLPKLNTDATLYTKLIVTVDGENPVISPTITDWVTLPDPTTNAITSIEAQLNDNVPKYPTFGASAWRGPYVPGLKKDPWGHKYIVVIKGLSEPELEGTYKKQRAVFVISAGPNGIIETAFDQVIKLIDAPASAQGGLKFALGGDDIVSRIQ